jgi:hypothetical protein
MKRPGSQVGGGAAKTAPLVAPKDATSVEGSARRSTANEGSHLTGCAERAERAMKDFNGEEAERLLLHLYTGSRFCLQRRTADAVRFWPASASTRSG